MFHPYHLSAPPLAAIRSSNRITRICRNQESRIPGFPVSTNQDDGDHPRCSVAPIQDSKSVQFSRTELSLRLLGSKFELFRVGIVTRACLCQVKKNTHVSWGGGAICSSARHHYVWITGQRSKSDPWRKRKSENRFRFPRC